MRAVDLVFHHLWGIFDKVSQSPTDWPFIFFLPVIVGISIASHEKLRARLTPFAKPIVLAGSVLTLLAVFRIVITYLSMNFISDAGSTLFATISWLFCLGQPVYSSIHMQAPYSLPYGPYSYMLVGCFQQALGPSVFSSKLAPFLATFGSWIFLYLALRRRVAWLSALALTALAAALLLPFDPMQFWPRPDPFLLFSVSGGLWAATRRGVWGPILLGFFIGFAINLKFYAFIIFFLAIAVGWRTNKSLGLWMLAGLVTVVTALLPFAWPNISMRDYLLVLKMHSDSARFMDVFAAQCFEWGVVFFMIGFSPLFVNKGEAGETISLLRKNFDLWGSLLLSFFLVSFPASNEGASPHHLMPFIPLVIYLAAHLNADISSRPFLRRTHRWAGLSLALSIVLVAGLDAFFLSIKVPVAFGPKEALAKEQIADIEQIFQEKMPCVLLNATGSLATHQENFYRTILVFNGMPIGIDPAGEMDYKSLGGYEPNLPAVVAELKLKYNQPIVWICPKDTVPFSLTSYYGSCDKVFSDKFVNDFHRLFQLSGQSSCFDIYEEKSN